MTDEPTKFSLGRIHEFDVIGEVVSTDRRHRVILVDRGEKYNDRYVTALHTIGDSEWDNGGYFVHRTSAIRDFADRAMRQV